MGRCWPGRSTTVKVGATHVTRGAGFVRDVTATVASMDPTPEAPLRARQGAHGTRRVVVLSGLAGLVGPAVLGFPLARPSPWERAGALITVSAWAPYWQPDAALASFSDNAAVFSDVSMFAYHATAADAVTPYDGVDPNTRTSFAEHASPAGVALTASIIDDTAAGAMATILGDPTSRALHVQTIVAFANDNGFDGIDLDYEKFAFSDGRDTWA